MALYYRDQHVLITSQAVRVDGVTYPVRELDLVWHQRGSGTARTRSRLLGRGVLILIISVLPLVAIVCGVSLVYSAQARENWGLAAVVIAVCLIGALALAPLAEVPLGWLDRSYDRGSGVTELWVRHRGADLMLLREADAHRFGQIYRALQRAVEEDTP
jgi:hypothetical protein